MKNLFGVLKHIRGYWKYACLNVASNIFTVVFGLFSLTMIIPFLNLLFLSDEKSYQDILMKGKPPLSVSVHSALDNLNYYFTQTIVEKGKLEALVMICIIFISIIFLKNFFRYLALFFMAPVRNGIVRDMRNNIFDKTLDLPLSYYSNERKGDIMSRITTDVQEVEWSVLTGLEMIFRDPLNILLSLLFLVFLSPMLTLFVVLLLPVASGLIALIGRSLKKSSARAKERLGTLFSIMEETLSGLRIIKGFNAEPSQKEKFYSENQAFTKQMVSTYRKVDLASPMSELLGTMIMMVIMYIGGRLVIDDRSQSLKPAEFVAYLAIFSQIIPPAKSITQAYYNVQRGMASIERINKILKADVTIREKENAKPKKTFDRVIEYKNVSFAYVRGDNGYVLKDINLKIEKGKTIALVGQSGSGKSTLADMLPRFYDIDGGELLIDGVDLIDLKIKDLRNLMGIVTQESILFNDTVFNNIAFGMKNANEEDVIAAAKIANAHEFIVQMPNGYKTNIGDRGSKLSGGQRQRLSIARAVLKNPPILILDEATSALDTESEKLVQDALNNLMKNRTSLVIAHRLSTIQHADEIIVMQKGEIIERGTHNALIGKAGAYRKLYDLQSFV